MKRDVNTILGFALIICIIVIALVSFSVAADFFSDTLDPTAQGIVIFALVVILLYLFLNIKR